MNKNKIKKAVRDFLLALGEDVEREGLVETPERVARMCEEMFSSYNTGADDFSHAIFSLEKRSDQSSFVLVKDLSFSSVCEHHILPFFGKIHIAYIPKNCVVGLSKLSRIVSHCSKKLQLQERLTQEIASRLDEVVPNDGIAIFCEAEHLCMSIRGVKQHGATTVTTLFTKNFKADALLQQQFFVSVK